MQNKPLPEYRKKIIPIEKSFFLKKNQSQYIIINGNKNKIANRSCLKLNNYLFRHRRRSGSISNTEWQIFGPSALQFGILDQIVKKISHIYDFVRTFKISVT